MNQRIKILLPEDSLVISSIPDFYVSMYEKFKREYPTDVTYTKQKLQRNIRSVLSIAFKSIPKTQIIGSTYEQWDAKGYKEIRFKN